MAPPPKEQDSSGPIADAMAQRLFIYLLIGASLWIGAVIIFVL